VHEGPEVTFTKSTEKFEPFVIFEPFEVEEVRSPTK